jgi:hypothetical protein
VILLTQYLQECQTYLMHVSRLCSLLDHDLLQLLQKDARHRRNWLPACL